MMTRRIKIEILILGAALAIGSVAPAYRTYAQEPAGAEATALERSLAEAIEHAQADARHRHQSLPDTQSLIEDAVRASIVQSGGEPRDVLVALNHLPAALLTSQAASAAVNSIKAEVDALVSDAKSAGASGAAGAPVQAPSILSAPPPSAGGGGGGGSDYRPG